MKSKVLVLTLFACLMLSGLAFADEVLVKVNDQFINHDDLVVYQDGVTYGLVSEFAGRMGVELDWLEVAKLAVLKIGEDYVSFQMDSDLLIINNKDFKMKGRTITINNRIYVPLEDLAAQLKIEYAWDPQLLLMSLKNPAFKVDASEIRKVNFTVEDVLWLSRIIDIEANGKSLNKKIAVANVVLNRVASPRFPNSVYDVIFQRGQFPPAYYSRFATLVPVESSVIAAKRALMGVEVAKDCLLFNNRPFASKSDSFYKLIEGDYFYY